LKRASALLVLALSAVSARARADEDADRERLHAASGLDAPDILALRTGIEDVRDRGQSTSAGFEIWEAAYGPTARMAGLARIGGGEDGADGAFAADLAFGDRADLGDHHGPFLRGGARGHYFGSFRLMSSFLEVPQVQLGYQYKKNDRDLPLLFELGGRSGFVVAGRTLTAGSRADIGLSADVGGHAAVGIGPVRLEAGYMRVFEKSLGEPSLEVFDGTACGHYKVIGGCVDARVFAGQGFDPAGQPVRELVVQAGFFFGLWIQYL
jgi:hypothetical protein